MPTPSRNAVLGTTAKEAVYWQAPVGCGPYAFASLPNEERWELVLRHCRLVVEGGRNGDERQTLIGMRSRLMAYCKGFPGAKELRQRLCQVTSVTQVEELAEFSISRAHAGDED